MLALPGMEEQRWGQHAARPALTSRSRRANIGPGGSSALYPPGDDSTTASEISVGRVVYDESLTHSSEMMTSTAKGFPVLRAAIYESRISLSGLQAGTISECLDCRQPHLLEF